MLSHVYRTFLLLTAVLLLTGCGISAGTQPAPDPLYTETVAVEYIDIFDEAVALSESPAAQPSVLQASAPGTDAKTCDSAVIDYSNIRDGYVMVKYTAATAQRLKVLVQGPTTTYNYNINAQEWTVFPLSDGNGTYSVSLYINAYGTKYAAVLSASFTVSLNDEFGPFLYPNQYVDYASAPDTVAKAAELTAGLEHPLDKVAAVYDYVVETLTYDTQKAATVQSGYLPVLDDVLEGKKGICFDYSALMAGMLRSQNIPCKLVVGYAGTAYHAWISVWSEETGWIDAAIFFNGSAWQRMDPTFASSSDRSSSIMEYIGNGTNYTEKYIY